MLKDLINLQLFAEGKEPEPVDPKQTGDINNTNTKEPNGDNATGDKNKPETKENKLKELLAQDEGLYKEYQSIIDSRVSQAIKTRDKKHQDELEKQQRLAKMTEEELIQERQRELEEREQKVKQYELKLKKIEYFKDNDIPLDLVDYIIVEEEDEIEEKANKLSSMINKVVEERVKQQLSQNGLDINTNKNSSPNIQELTVDDFEGMTTEQINAYFDKLS